MRRHKKRRLGVMIRWRTEVLFAAVECGDKVEDG